MYSNLLSLLIYITADTTQTNIITLITKNENIYYAKNYFESNQHLEPERAFSVMNVFAVCDQKSLKWWHNGCYDVFETILQK